jgi:4-hydroxy-4-methyl-2-oxoglutarate aldolase
VSAAELLGLGAATLGESGAMPMRARIRAAWRGARVAGRAVPVQCTPGDNLAIHAAVADAPSGCVLVVSVGEQRELGYWGEVLTTAAEARGVAGLVIDGGVRDIDALEAHRFAVFATTTALPGASKRAPGSVGAPVTVGDVVVAADDWIVGDADGVVTIGSSHLDDVLQAARARAEKERQFFADLRGGATTVGLLGLDTTPIERRSR